MLQLQEVYTTCGKFGQNTNMKRNQNETVIFMESKSKEGKKSDKNK